MRALQQHPKVQTLGTLELHDNVEKMTRLRVAFWTQHAHQTLGGFVRDAVKDDRKDWRWLAEDRACDTGCASFPPPAQRLQMWPHVAIICPVTSTGIRELKDNLSRYIRRIEAGERIAITAHGRVVAELVPPGSKTRGTPSRFDELVASGVIRPPLEAGDPTEGWPDIRLPAGTAAELIDADRGEA